MAPYVKEDWRSWKSQHKDEACFNTQICMLFNGWWAAFSNSRPAAFWDDITLLKEWIPIYTTVFDINRDVTLGDKISLNYLN